MRVEFHPEAMAEFHAAAEYYEKQHSGLGSRRRVASADF